MKAFATLYSRLDATTSSNAKLAAMRDYFRDADPADAAWAVYFLSGGRPRKGSSLSCIHTASPSSELCSASGISSEMVSAMSPTAW